MKPADRNARIPRGQYDDPVTRRRYRIMMWARWPMFAAGAALGWWFGVYWPMMALLALWLLVLVIWVGAVGKY